MIFILLLAGTVVLNVFLTVFGHSSLFPLDIFDFVFLFALSFGLALYRPGWAFLLFLSVLPFEVLNLVPSGLSLSVRPYQLVGASVMGALLLRFGVGRLGFTRAPFRWFDSFPLVFALGGFVALLNAVHAGSAVKQLIVALSFVALYFLTRQFFSEVNDARRAVWFLVVSGGVASIFALVQNLRFAAGVDSFEAMPGRPNAFFPEADWFGMYLIFLASIALVLILKGIEDRKLGTKNKESKMKKEELGIRNKGSRIGDTEWRSKSQKLAEWGSKFLGDISFCFKRFCFLIWNFQLLILFLGFFFLILIYIALILSVARSAWVGMAAAFFVATASVFFIWRGEIFLWRRMATFLGVTIGAFVLALLSVFSFHLTSFDLSSRTSSTASGYQRITVSCNQPVVLPEYIQSTDDLDQYSCRFIRLEEIDTERSLGRTITTTLRPDPSIGARRAIFSRVSEVICEHPFLGIGWGEIGSILGKDDRGSALSSSNAFLEVWLGGGLLSFFAFLALWMTVPALASIKLFSRTGDFESRLVAVFFLVSWVGFSFFNLFNSGILLGFVWVWLGGIGMLATKPMDS